MNNDERQELRQQYFDAWQKHLNKQPVTPLETEIIDVVLLHPEYHPALENLEDHVDKDFLPEGGETNPFLHMGLHLGLREQLSTNRPEGIQTVYQQLLENIGDAHKVEHRMMDCLAETLWEAQRAQEMPDEGVYMGKLLALA